MKVAFFIYGTVRMIQMEEMKNIGNAPNKFFKQIKTVPRVVHATTVGK